MVQPSHTALKIRDQLDSTGAVANDGDTLSHGIEIGVPVGCMSQNPLVFRHARVIRKLPRIEPPHGSEHKVHFVVDDGVGGHICDGQ